MGDCKPDYGCCGGGGFFGGDNIWWIIIIVIFILCFCPGVFGGGYNNRCFDNNPCC
jgi:hypothetical protein